MVHNVSFIIKNIGIYFLYIFYQTKDKRQYNIYKNIV